MSIEVTARNKEIPSALHAKAKEKGGLLKDEFPALTALHVVLDSDKHLYKVQISATYTGTLLSSEAADAENFLKSLDEAFEKMHRQLRKLQDKIGDNRKP